MLLGAFYTAYAEEGEEADGENTAKTSDVSNTKEDDPPIAAQGEGMHVTFPEHVWQGGEFEVVFSLDLPLSHAVNGSFTYEAGMLTLVECTSSLEEWTLNYSQSENTITYLLIDTQLSYPVQGQTELFTAKFSLSQDVPEGTELTLSASNVNVTDGAKDTLLKGCEATTNVLAALKHPSGLVSLSVTQSGEADGGKIELSPEFSSDVTEYSVYVDNLDSDFEIVYAADEFSHVNIDKVINEGRFCGYEITVISDDGVEGRKYTLNFYDSKGPIPNGDTNSQIKDIILSDGILSVSFDSTVHEYTVYITSKIGEVKITAIPQNAALSAIELILDLKSDQKQALVCTAENGDTTEYYFTVKTVSEDEYADLLGKQRVLLDNLSIGVIVTVLAAVALTGFLVGFVIAALFKGGNKRKNSTASKKNNAGGASNENNKSTTKKRKKRKSEKNENENEKSSQDETDVQSLLDDEPTLSGEHNNVLYPSDDNDQEKE